MVSGSDRHASQWRHALRVPGADGLDLDHPLRGPATVNREGVVDAFEALATEIQRSER
jgi:hypothetical protein